MQKTKPANAVGYLAQAYDEAVPDGATGFAAAEAIIKFLKAAGFTILPTRQD